MNVSAHPFQRRFRLNTALAVAAALALAACGRQEAAPAPTVQRSVPVEVVTTAAAPFTETYRITVVARPVEVHHLSAEVTGTLEALHADVGERVQAGAVLARFDPVPLTLAADTRRAELERARVSLTLKQKTFARRQALYREGTVAEPAVEEAELAVRLAEADLKLAELALKDAERDLGHATVTAPAAGEVTARFPEPGAVLARGAPLFHLARTDRIRMVAGLSERQVVHVQPGVAGTVRFDALPGQVFPAEVVRVGSVDQPGEAAFPVELHVPNGDGVIRPGMVGRVDLPGRRLERAVTVPAVALRKADDEVGLFVVEDGRARHLPVTVTALVDERAVIGEGIPAGARVVVVGQTSLKGGETVEVTAVDGAEVSGTDRPTPVYGLP